MSRSTNRRGSSVETFTFHDDKGVIRTILAGGGNLNLVDHSETVRVVLKGEKGAVLVTALASKACPHCGQLVTLQHIVAESGLALQELPYQGIASIHHNPPNCLVYDETSENIGVWTEGMVFQ